MHSLQRGQYGGHVHVALAERQVDVAAALHVLDGHGAEHIGKLAHCISGVALTGDQAVPGVECQLASWHAEGAPVVDGLDGHAGFRLQGGDDTHVLGEAHHCFHATEQPTARLFGCHAGFWHTGPEAHGLATRLRHGLERAREEADTSSAAVRVGGDQGRFVLGAWVKQEARPRLDDATQVQRTQPCCHMAQVERELWVKWVQVVDVQSKRHAVVAGFGDEGERVVQPMMRSPIGVEGEPQCHRRCSMASGA